MSQVSKRSLVGDAGEAAESALSVQEGLQRALPDNCVEYVLVWIDGTSQQQPLRAALETVRKEAMRLCNELTKDYIWQRDEFTLELKTQRDLLYLGGATTYGDCIEDEWLIVYLLRRLTQAFPKLWVHASDDDGSFLLIEAARVVPSWLTPETDAYRGWLHQGQFFLIPQTLTPEMPSVASSSTKRPLTLLEAREILKRPGILSKLVHSPLVEAEALYRLEKYPKHIGTSIHRAQATIPRRLAYVLHSRPRAVAPAVEAFYLRDGAALRRLYGQPGPQSTSTTGGASIKWVGSQLVFAPTDLVTITVRMTRVLYAQLVSQHFPPPPLWEPLIPAQAAATEGTVPGVTATATAARKRAELGMKLTVGFELLMANASTSDRRVVREIDLLLADLEEDGPDALPGDGEISRWDEAKGVDDDDGWMDVDFNAFEAELRADKGAGTKGTETQGKVDWGDEAAHANLRKIVQRFEEFLNDEKAGVDGVDVEGDDNDEWDSDEDDDFEDDESDEEDKAVSFDEAQFAAMMRDMMGMPSEAPRSGPSGAPADSKMPTSHAKEDNDKEEKAAIAALSAQMEAELRGRGALKLAPPKEPTRRIEATSESRAKDKGKSRAMADEPEAVDPGKKDVDDDEDDSDEDGEVDIDYNLAANLLESFRSQGGASGPASNILNLMGITLPRDEGEPDERQAPKQA